MAEIQIDNSKIFIQTGKPDNDLSKAGFLYLYYIMIILRRSFFWSCLRLQLYSDRL